MANLIESPKTATDSKEGIARFLKFPSPPKTRWSVFGISPNTSLALKRERFLEDHIANVNLRVEKPPDANAFEVVEELPAYGRFLVEDGNYLAHDTGDLELWLFTRVDKTERTYGVYWFTPFQCAVIGYNVWIDDLAVLYSKMNTLHSTMFSAVETAALLEKIKEIPGVSRKGIAAIIAGVMDSFVKGMNVNGASILSSVTSGAFLIDRGAKIHPRIFNLIFDECLRKQ